MLVLTKKLLADNTKNYEWLSCLNILIEEVEDNLLHKPDISIEACKSLLEAIGKNILGMVHTAYDGEEDNCNKSLNTLLKVTKEKLLEKSGYGEDDYLQRLISVAHVIGEIRNKRADISHGKVFPKPVVSSIAFAKSIVSITDGFAFYILDIFLTIDLEYKEKIKYEDNDELNASIDEQFNTDLDKSSFSNKISFSKALFEQDYDAYYLHSIEFKNQNIALVEDGQNAEFEVNINVGTELELHESKIDKYLFNFDAAKFDLSLLFSKYKLDDQKVKDLIGELVLNDEKPRNDQITEILLEQPKISERMQMLKSIIMDLSELIDKHKILIT